MSQFVQVAQSLYCFNYSAQSNHPIVQEVIKNRRPLIIKNGYLFEVNGKALMSEGEYKKWTLESFEQALTDNVGAGNCISEIHADELKCDSHTLTQLWTSLMKRIINTGLKKLMLF